MCTYNITEDERTLASRYPGVPREKFGQWLQRWVDDMMSVDTPAADTRLSPNAQTYEEMKSAIRERIDRIEAGEAKFYSHEEVFSKMIIRQEPPAMMDLETVRENLHQMVREVYAQA